MISPEKEQLVRELDAKGFTIRQIAKEAKVARGTIASVLKRPPRTAPKFYKNPVRCPKCRYTVVMPCPVCGHRPRKKKRRPKYLDNLFLSIRYSLNTSLTPHSRTKEDEWDEHYARTHPWLTRKRD